MINKIESKHKKEKPNEIKNPDRVQNNSRPQLRSWLAHEVDEKPSDAPENRCRT